MVLGRASPAAADGIPGYQLVSVNSTISSATFRTVTAQCPAGKELIGFAGKTTGHVYNVGQAVSLEKIEPNIGTESVTVSARENRTGTINNWLVSATAVCANAGTVPGIYIADNVESDGGSSSVSSHPECNGNDQTLSVGFEFSGAPGRLHLTSLLPTDTTGFAVGREDSVGTTASWELRTIAICAPLSPSQTVLDFNVGLSTAGPAAVTVTDCPDGFSTTSSGGSIDPDPGAEDYVTLTSFYVAFIHYSTPDENHFYSSVSSTEGLTTASVAGCRRRVREDRGACSQLSAWWTRPAPRSASRSATRSCMEGTWPAPRARTTPCPKVCKTRRIS
jgi:hypothetical protein